MAVHTTAESFANGLEAAYQRTLEVMGEAAEVSLDEIAPLIRDKIEELGMVITANMRNSVGHRGPIPAQPTTKQFAPIDWGKHARFSKSGVKMRMPIGMEYAGHANKRKDFTTEPLLEAEEIFARNFGDASQRLEVELREYI